MIYVWSLVALVCTLPRTAHSVEHHLSLRHPRERDTVGSSTPEDTDPEIFDGQPGPLHVSALRRSRRLLDASVTVPNVGGKVCASAVGAAELERHDNKEHGDVCRCAQACQF
jgi:hypothetical protein